MIDQHTTGIERLIPWHTASPAHLASSSVYLASTDLPAIARTFIRLLAAEDYHPIAPPTAAQLATLAQNPDLRRDWLDNLVSIALWPGAPGWTLVHCQPLALVSEPAPGNDQPRLGELAARLGSFAFVLNNYRHYSQLLIEAGPAGQMLVSGGVDDDDAAARPKERPPWPLNSRAADRRELRFYLLAVEPALQDALSDPDAEARLAEQLAGPSQAYWRNTLSAVEDPDYVAGVEGALLLYFQHLSVPPLGGLPS